jgi:antibiotic biosynthesis monooxygenase (ABM) superfamily enzyme
MATALFTVKATVPPGREAAFNEWYNHEHVPDVLRFKGVVSARRYRSTEAADRFQYMAVYEFESEETLRRFLASEHFAGLIRDYNAHFADSQRERGTWVQVWP